MELNIVTALRVVLVQMVEAVLPIACEGPPRRELDRRRIRPKERLVIDQPCYFFSRRVARRAAPPLPAMALTAMVATKARRVPTGTFEPIWV